MGGEGVQGGAVEILLKQKRARHCETPIVHGNLPTTHLELLPGDALEPARLRDLRQERAHDGLPLRLLFLLVVRYLQATKIGKATDSVSWGPLN